ncbi:unnamed protein product [Brassicogethes aeneus]|uniref:C2H2-type domain-containing protein n=1 Tax=Brassicogethes aeneus TaxID=1431903 RepID=A0A9P0FC01_BRAAE|nr:unnamed protein product [Brassicogethes aeneus]
MSNNSDVNNDSDGFDKNFKIPKRKAEETKVQNVNEEMLVQQNVLANSYYNYQYGQMGLFGPWQPPDAGYYQYPQPGPSSEPITQQIYNTLISHKEKPKTYSNNIFRQTVPDCNDATLPKELTMLFQPLYCKLCLAQLSSNVMAKLHYKSKNHEKKIKKFLIEHAERTGEPLHKRAKVSVAKSTDDESKDPRYFHCEVCDLPLTGKLHAESHYMGKNHQKAIMGHKTPAGKGFWNDSGKWVRLKSEKKTDIASGSDTFGLDFRPKPAVAPVLGPVMPAAGVAKFHCDICNVGATCQQQLDMHYKGQKHLKKMKQLGIRLDPEVHVEAKSRIVEQTDLSAYRTPSGNYYCQSCNITLNSETQFKVHLSSKNHYKKINKVN